MPKLIFAAQNATQAAAKAVTSECLINCYPEPQPEGSRSPLLLRPVPGLEAFATGIHGGSTDAEVINAVALDNIVYVMSARVVSGTPDIARYYIDSVTTGGTVTNVDILDAGTTIDVGGAWLSVNNGFLCYTAGNVYKTHEIIGGAETTPTGAFASEVYPTTLQGYTIFSQRAGRLFEWTPLGAPDTRDSLNFATKEARPDLLARCEASQGRLYLLGASSTEIWGVTGLANDEAFAQIPGAVYDVGVMDRASVLAAFDHLFVVTHDRKVAMWRGSQLALISTRPVEENLSAVASGDMTLLGLEHGGRKFVIVRYADRPSDIYDLTTGAWHQRSASGGTSAAWPVKATVYAFGATGDGRWYGFANYGSGIVMQKFTDVTTENGSGIVRLMRSRPLDIEGSVYRIPKIEFRVQSGGADITTALRLSRDNGQTWGTSRTRTLANADHDGRIRYLGNGHFRNLTAELTVTGTPLAPVEAAAVVDIA